MNILSNHRIKLATLAATLSLTLLSTGCSTNNNANAEEPAKVTINVALAAEPPTKSALEAFTKETGITVNWTNIDWDSLQTKIASAATAGTYFADATNVDWSRVGQLGKLGWFQPLNKFLDVSALAADMPQLASFKVGDNLIGVPYDASFMVTTVNKDSFAKAGITAMPKTFAEYQDNLNTIKKSQTVEYPLNIPFAAAEGLSTYWFHATIGVFGGKILDGSGKPQFKTKDSAGYKAAAWMVDSLKNGLVSPGNINVTDSQGMQTLMAKGAVATTLGDYSGNLGSLYNVPDTSTQVNKIQYIPTPGTSSVGSNISNPDGIGIPVKAKYPKAAAKFLQWFTSSQTQQDFTGIGDPTKAWSSAGMPSRVSVLKVLSEKGKVDGGDLLVNLLTDHVRPVFPDGVPTWYPEFSRAAYTNLHAAAANSMSLDDAIAAIAATADKLSSGS